MIEITLNEYVKKVTQKVAASSLNVTPGAIGKAVSSDRKIIIRTDDQGVVIAAYEVKSFGNIPAVF